MLLWVFVALVLISATGILVAAQGPLRATASARILRVFAFLQFALAAVLVVARLSGWA